MNVIGHKCRAQSNKARLCWLNLWYIEEVSELATKVGKDGNTKENECLCCRVEPPEAIQWFKN